MRLRRDFLRSIEAAVMGLFLIQAIRYLYGTIYAHISSADLVRRVANPETLAALPGYIEPASVEREALAIGIALLSPLLAIFLARTLWSIPLAVAVGVVGRSMALQVPDSAALAAALVVGASLTYMIILIVRRPAHFPGMLLMGVLFDQLVRASENSRDLTWNPDYELFGVAVDQFSLGVALATLFVSGLATLNDLEIERLTEGDTPRGTLSGWGSFALGAFFFIELTLLGLPNAVARWAEVSYALAVPWLLLATALPLVPFVRTRMRAFLGAFDGVWRGWLWALLLGLFFVLGNRFDGELALAVLVLAQFNAGLTLWWMVKPAQSSLPNPTPILVLLSVGIFALLSVGDYFTYDYAYVRDFEEPFAPLADVLRGFEDFGLPLFLVAALILCMPIILERRVIPWQGGRQAESFFNLILVAVVTISSVSLVAPPPLRTPDNFNCLRIGSLNIHSGYTLLFDQNLDRVKQALSVRDNLDIDLDVVLLQEVDTGRLSSYGVDQVEWLARELGMESAYFPQNEALHGLAVLSRVPIREMRGELLTSQGPQAALLYVELALDENPFHVYNVWLGYQTLDPTGVPEPLEVQDQTRQTEAIENIIVRNHAAENFESRIALGGTFNYDRNTPLYNFWQDETTFFDPFSDLRIEDAKTIFLVDGSSARYDYIWLMNLAPSGVVIDRDFVVSDHRLSVVEVKRTPEQQCGG